MSKGLFYIFVVGILLLTGCGNQSMSWVEVKRIHIVDNSKTETPRNKEGKIEGVVKKYYKAGSLYSTSEYVNGKKHGMERIYSPMYTKIDYDSDVYFKRVPSKWKTYLFSEVNYVHGKKEGIEKIYEKMYIPNARPIAKERKLSSTIPYVNGKKHGYQKFYSYHGAEKDWERILWQRGIDVKEERINKARGEMMDEHDERVRECYKRRYERGIYSTPFCDQLAKKRRF